MIALRARLLAALMFFSACTVTSAAQQAIKTGPEVGSMLPSFEAPDQNGRLQHLQSIRGPKGALLVFFRSADW
jgi:cytochrome oxidase Cu insertion factor (SCO1/SenC/PrrC family)